MSIISIVILIITAAGTIYQVYLELRQVAESKDHFRDITKAIARPRKLNGQFAKEIGITYTQFRKNYNLAY